MKVSYTGILITPESANLLVQHFQIPDGWDIKAHHMTINMGSADNGPAHAFLGDSCKLTVTSFGENNLVMAVGVNTYIPSKNKIKHITLAVNSKEGGKPYMSNEIKLWTPVEHILLEGHITEFNVVGNPLTNKKV